MGSQEDDSCPGQSKGNRKMANKLLDPISLLVDCEQIIHKGQVEGSFSISMIPFFNPLLIFSKTLGINNLKVS